MARTRTLTELISDVRVRADNQALTDGEITWVRHPYSAFFCRAARIVAAENWWANPGLRKTAAPVLERLCARYLLREGRGIRALDPVAHFHLSNGARVERLNWRADVSENGLRQSCGLMVNYLYDLDDIEKNHEAYAEERTVVASNAVRTVFLGLTRALLVMAPGSGHTRRYCQKLTRFSSAFALAADAAMFVLGGSLKRRERFLGALEIRLELQAVGEDVEQDEILAHTANGCFEIGLSFFIFNRVFDLADFVLITRRFGYLVIVVFVEIGEAQAGKLCAEFLVLQCFCVLNQRHAAVCHSAGCICRWCWLGISIFA